MATPTLGDSEFLVAACGACDKNVLTHLDIDSDDNEIRRCIHCDALLSGGFKVVGREALAADGYVIIEARICGNGGGCSTGRCGGSPLRN